MLSFKYGINNEYIISGKIIENSVISIFQLIVVGVVGVVINCGDYMIVMSMKVFKYSNYVFDNGFKLLFKLVVNCIV